MGRIVSVSDLSKTLGLLPRLPPLPHSLMKSGARVVKQMIFLGSAPIPCYNITRHHAAPSATAVQPGGFSCHAERRVARARLGSQILSNKRNSLHCLLSVCWSSPLAKWVFFNQLQLKGNALLHPPAVGFARQRRPRWPELKYLSEGPLGATLHVYLQVPITSLGHSLLLHRYCPQWEFRGKKRSW